jgi:hypothetical protein
MNGGYPNSYQSPPRLTSNSPLFALSKSPGNLGSLLSNIITPALRSPLPRDQGSQGGVPGLSTPGGGLVAVVPGSMGGSNTITGTKTDIPWQPAIVVTNSLSDPFSSGMDMTTVIIIGVIVVSGIVYWCNKDEPEY